MDLTCIGFRVAGSNNYRRDCVEGKKDRRRPRMVYMEQIIKDQEGVIFIIRRNNKRKANNREEYLYGK